jgi:hypothetical protein
LSDCGRVTLVLYRRRAMRGQVGSAGFGARSIKPSEGSRWRGGCGEAAGIMGFECSVGEAGHVWFRELRRRLEEQR